MIGQRAVNSRRCEPGEIERTAVRIGHALEDRLVGRSEAAPGGQLGQGRLVHGRPLARIAGGDEAGSTGRRDKGRDRLYVGATNRGDEDERAGTSTGWVVVVTGASTGLGRAIAVETADRGAAAVVINFASSEAEAKETARQVEAQAPRRYWPRAMSPATPIAAPSPTPPSRSAASTPCSTTPEPPSSPDHADLDAVSGEDFLRLYGVNVVGAFQMIRAARSLLEAAPQPGAVVNTASIAGVMGIGSSVPYAASKGAMITMTLSLARALAPKIRVNAVCPGYIDTPWFGRGMDAGAARAVCAERGRARRR